MNRSFAIILLMLTGVGMAMSLAWVEHQRSMPLWVFMILFIAVWLIASWRIIQKMEATEAADAEKESHADYD